MLFYIVDRKVIDRYFFISGDTSHFKFIKFTKIDIHSITHNSETIRYNKNRLSNKSLHFVSALGRKKNDNCYYFLNVKFALNINMSIF